MNKSNLVDIKSICFILSQYLRGATKKEQLWFSLEVNRMLSKFVSDDEPTEPKPKTPLKERVKLV